MWNVNTEVIPIIKEAAGTISKSIRKHLSHILGNQKINELQKTARLDTAHILWSPNVKVQTIQHWK
jgi:hypothetical protein